MTFLGHKLNVSFKFVKESLSTHEEDGVIQPWDNAKEILEGA
jgi:hypothetical protein